MRMISRNSATASSSFPCWRASRPVRCARRSGRDPDGSLHDTRPLHSASFFPAPAAPARGRLCARADPGVDAGAPHAVRSSASVNLPCSRSRLGELRADRARVRRSLQRLSELRFGGARDRVRRSADRPCTAWASATRARAPMPPRRAGGALPPRVRRRASADGLCSVLAKAADARAARCLARSVAMVSTCSLRIASASEPDAVARRLVWLAIVWCSCCIPRHASIRSCVASWSVRSAIMSRAVASPSRRARKLTCDRVAETAGGCASVSSSTAVYASISIGVRREPLTSLRL